jgi:hypothetical protein
LRLSLIDWLDFMPLMNEKPRKIEAHKKASPKDESRYPAKQWRVIFKNTLRHIHSSWIPSLVLGLLFFILGPVVAALANKSEYVYVSVALGLTIIICTIAILVIAEIPHPKRPTLYVVLIPGLLLLVMFWFSAYQMIRTIPPP